jgi:hypothetical protein
VRRAGQGAAALDHAVPVLAVALAAVLLAACTAGRTGKPAASAGAGAPGKSARGFRLAGPGGVTRAVLNGHGAAGVVIYAAAGPGAGFVALPAGGPAGPSGRPHISVPPIPPAGSPQAVAMPLDSYEEVSVQEQDALTAADDLLTQQCMLAAGFSYPVTAQPGGGAATVQAIEADGYGVTSLAQAQAYGYKSPGQGAGAAAPFSIVLPGFVGEQGKHGTAWTSALLGFVPGARANAPQREGCLQAADSELYGTLSGDPDPDPVPQIAIQAAQWTQSDPRVLAVQRAWSACMARSGHAYKSPAQAQSASWPSTPTPAEIATAVADVACKTQANLVNTWLTVEAAYQQALISQNLTSLAQLQTHFGALLRRAENLLRQPAVTGILRLSQGPAGQRIARFTAPGGGTPTRVKRGGP